MRGSAVSLFLLLGVVGTWPVGAQGIYDPDAAVAEAEAFCATDPESAGCALAEARLVALTAEALADAGNTRDRGTFIALVREALADPSPEIRSSALYALAKLQPDATDTPAIMAALFDPVSNVRGGAWAAAGASSDAAARAVVDRVPVRPPGRGYGPNPEPYDPGALGVPIPAGAEYLWLTERLREEGQLQFLTDATPAEVLAAFAALADGPPVTPAAANAAYPEASFVFGDFDLPTLYADPQILVLPATEARTARMVVAYRDLVFGRTGFSVVQEFRAAIVLPPRAEAPALLPEAASDEAEAAALLAELSKTDPAAPEAETDLYLAIRSAYGFGAEAYLELYPEGAYAEEMRSLLAGPRVVLDALSYPDTGRIGVSLQNLPAGATATLSLHQVGAEYRAVDSLFLPDPGGQTAVFELAGKHAPGVYLLRAEVIAEGQEPLYLRHDLSIFAAPVDLSLERTEFAPREPIEVTFSGMSGHEKDYLATAEVGMPGSAYLDYVYLNGLGAGTVTLPAPATPGRYELRAFFRDDDSRVRASLEFTVAEGTAPRLETPAPEEIKSQDLSDPAAEPRPDPPVAEIVTPPGAGGAVLTMEKSTLAPGETIRLTFAGMSGAGRDFVTTAAEGTGPESYIKFVYTDGAREGSATLVAPEKEGAYELRAIFASDPQRVQAMLPFTVRADVQLTLEKTSFAPGEMITVGFSGFSGATQDYVSTAPAGSAASSYITYAYTNGAREGSLSLKAPDAPGDYEVRAFLQQGDGTAKVALPFTVAP